MCPQHMLEHTHACTILFCAHRCLVVLYYLIGGHSDAVQIAWQFDCPGFGISMFWVDVSGAIYQLAWASAGVSPPTFQAVAADVLKHHNLLGEKRPTVSSCRRRRLETSPSSRSCVVFVALCLAAVACACAWVCIACVVSLFLGH